MGFPDFQLPSTHSNIKDNIHLNKFLRQIATNLMHEIQSNIDFAFFMIYSCVTKSANYR